MSVTTSNRHAWVDLAKGISIILVVMMHATYGVGEETGRVGFMHYVLAFATPFRMPEFFMIAGLFLSAVIARPWAHFADRRVVHYLYFYALWALILIVFKHLLIDRDPAMTVALLASAIYEPYSVLWFIYALALFSVLAKITHEVGAPQLLVFVVAAASSIAPIATPVSIVNYAAEYFVFFYAGYAFAPAIFRFAHAVGERPRIAALGLALWALTNTALIFSRGHEIAYGHIITGVATIPGATFALAIAGALAVCTAAVLASHAKGFAWLRWIGANSIVIYLSFVIPMGIFRTLLLTIAPGIDAGIASLATLIVAVVSPVLVYWIIGRVGFGRFLFERPDWAILPRAPGSRWTKQQPSPAPAE